MKRLAIPAIAAAVALLVFAVVNASGGGTAHARTLAVVHVIEHAETDATTNKAVKKGDAAGDLLTFANPVYNQADSKKIGSDQGFCVRITPGKSYECYWTTFLPAGQITVEGPFFDKSASVLAITGGTGAYAGARGSMALKARGTTKFDFIFRVSG